MEFTVLGLLGPAGSGKDLVADWLVEKKGFIKVAFADPMKRFVSRTFSIDHERLWGPSEKRNEKFKVDSSWWFEAIGHMGVGAEEIINEVLVEGTRTEGYLKLHDWLTNLRRQYPEEISARVILQTLGTEWGRAVDELMWARYAHKVARKLGHGKWFYTQGLGIVSIDSGTMPAGVVIPDHRFKNEVEMTKENHGYVIRLRRLAVEKADEVIGVAGHQSESEQKALPDDIFDHVFNFEEGVDNVYKALEGAYEQKLWINTRGPS